MVSPELRPGVPIADIDIAKELGVRSSFKPPVRNPSKRKPCATRSVALTEAGELLLARVAPAFRDIEDAIDDLNNFRGAPIGRLSFNTARASAKMVLLPLVARFLESHPKLNIEIVVDNDLVDMVSEGFDAGVRFGEIVALCRNVAADLAPLAIDEGYDLSFEQNTELSMIQGDAVSLERAVTNLVQNAIEHAGNQGVIACGSSRTA
ncbi:hypothetical protein IB267_15820 [Ensifer sp. ENS09]|uniref:LysR substrate-binding domain-containing protein n=1 Tax=Ensifer sp. ENS09 TaxID=2769263 RepID=UPI00178400D9|nr:hypothetical protein [Ensifer sp. ENS09]